MPITTTKTPSVVYRGNPPSSAHQPDVADIVQQQEEIIAGAAAAADVTAIKAKTDFITVTQAVDLDTLESLVTTGRAPKAPVAVATTANVTLSGEQTIDGVLTSTSRILVKDQSTASQNGIYVTAAGAWSRASDLDADAEVDGATVFVEGGTAGAGTTWQTTASGITIGTGAMPWVKVQDASDIIEFVGAIKDVDVVDESGHSASIKDASGRVLLAFDGEGQIADSHGFIQRAAELMAAHNTRDAIYNLPLLRTTDATFTDWNGVAIMGQSNAGGSNAGPITTAQPFDNKRLSGSSLIDLVEASVESCASGATAHAFWRVRKDLRPWDSFNDYRQIATNMGASGTALAGIEQGTTPYNTGLAAVTSIAGLATSASKTYAERAILLLHGETDSDNGTTQAAYKAGIIALKDDWNTDAGGETGQSDTIPMLIAQPGISDTGLISSNKGPVRAMLDAAEDDADIFVVVPGYICTMYDGLHYDAYDQRLIGEYFGKALHRYWIENRDPSTVRPLSWTRIDARTIEVTFFVPVPPLVFDTDRVWLPEDAKGFAVYASGGSEIAIADVRIVDPKTVRITTSADVSSGDFITYAEKAYTRTVTGGNGAGRTRGARGNLRDSDTTTAYYPDADGNLITLPNWSVSFRKELA